MVFLLHLSGYIYTRLIVLLKQYIAHYRHAVATYMYIACAIVITLSVFILLADLLLTPIVHLSSSSLQVPVLLIKEIDVGRWLLYGSI